MTASKDYILKDVVITMTCAINESIKNRTATFYRDRTFKLASVTYDEGGCTSNSSYTISSICNEMEKKISIEYTPLNTPSSRVFHVAQLHVFTCLVRVVMYAMIFV
jgi:hypothetical protein